MPSEKQIEAATSAIVDKIKTDGFIGYREAVSIILTAAEQAEPAPAAPEGRQEAVAWPEPKVTNPDIANPTGVPYLDCLIHRLLDAQQDINLAANERMDQSLCDASSLIDEVETCIRRFAALEPAEPAPAAEAVAWVAADTLNSPHPGCVSSLAYMSQIDKDTGREYVPLYTHPPVSRLREALEKLLACPAIADENHNDASWGCPDTAAAISFARAALKEASDECA